VTIGAPANGRRCGGSEIGEYMQAPPLYRLHVFTDLASTTAAPRAAPMVTSVYPVPSCLRVDPVPCPPSSPSPWTVARRDRPAQLLHARTIQITGGPDQRYGFCERV